VRVRVVSQYFPPEAGATQNRMESFVDGLAARGHSVTVLCEQPNHPAGIYHEGFGRRPVVTERRNGVTIHRLWVATSPRKTTARRVAFYGSFALGAGMAVGLGDRPDVLFATSPPLPGAAAAATAAHLRRIPYVLDVRDLWPAAAVVLEELSNPVVLRAAESVERWLYGHSARVTATTRPFCDHIDGVAGRAVSVHLPNGALDELLDLPDRPRPASGPFVVGYAGNLGIAQGLSVVLDAAERLRDEPVRFLLVGDGPLAAELRAERERRGLDAVEFRPAVPVAEIGDVLLSCDALLVPLRAHSLLEGFVPSKLYDAMAVGRPAIVAARGEAARLVAECRAGLVVEPEDGAALAEAVRHLAGHRDTARSLGLAGRRAARDYARSRQVERLEAVLSEASAPVARPR
jgi:colanic acid biosynthesis glycosyl transferase WcaI